MSYREYASLIPSTLFIHRTFEFCSFAHISFTHFCSLYFYKVLLNRLTFNEIRQNESPKFVRAEIEFQTNEFHFGGSSFVSHIVYYLQTSAIVTDGICWTFCSTIPPLYIYHILTYDNVIMSAMLYYHKCEYNYNIYDNTRIFIKLKEQKSWQQTLKF